MVAAAVVVVLTSLLLEDAAESMASSSVEFCGEEAGAVSELPFVTWLWFFWAICRRVMVLCTVGVA